MSQAPARPTTVTSLDSDTATAGTDSSQAAGTTKTFVVNGTNFARGTRLTVSGTGVTTTLVEFLSPEALRATFQSTAAAAPGNRNVTATRTDGAASAACTGCYTVTAAVSPSPSSTATPSATPTATASPSSSPSASPLVNKPTVNLNPSTIIAVEEKATVFGQGTPGSTLELYAYSRPSTDYVKVRSGRVGPDGDVLLRGRPRAGTPGSTPGP